MQISQYSCLQVSR